MKTVLVITSSKDRIADYMVSIYSQRCIFFRLDLDRICDYEIQINQYGWSIGNYREFVTDETIDAIYYSNPIYPDYRKYSLSFQESMKKDIDVIVKAITNDFSGKCLNRPELMERIENKIFQIYLAQKNHFIMPELLITNSTSCADKFCREDFIVEAPLRNFQNDLSDYIGKKYYESNNLEGVELRPIYIEKEIVGDFQVISNFICENSYSAKINKKSINNQTNKKFEVSNIILPNYIEEKCLNFMKDTRLIFGTFNFIVKKDEYYFLEFNANAQWLWLENELEWDLSSKIIDYFS